MRMLLGLAAATLAATIACAGRSTATTTTSTPAGGTTATATTQTQAQAPANTSGAQAAARLTPADLDDRMKNINTRNMALRMKLMAGNGTDAAKDAQELATLFGDVEKFWAQNNKTDAVKWAQDARTFATEAAGAATAGDVMKASAAANNMLGACKQCHGTYREMDPAGGFRIKAGVITQG